MTNGNRWAIRSVAMLAIVAGAAACETDGTREAAVAANADPAAVEAAFEDFRAAWEAQDLDAVLAAFTEDAVAYDPASPGRFEGREGIRSWAGGAFGFFEEISVTLEEVRVHTEGPVGWVTANYVFRGTPPEGDALVNHGYTSMLWVRAPDGGYRSPLFHASLVPEEGPDG